MITTSLSELAAVAGGELLGSDASVSSITTDSRSVQPGDLFVALKGDYFDGNEFAATAVEQGAVAVLVSREQAGLAASQILVADTTDALGDIASWHRQQWQKPLVAITGSCGKTTVKGMVAAILSEMATTLATEGNLNNHIGVPKTLLRLAPEQQFAVIEMGASAIGEIDYLVNLAKPQVALVNNVVPAHLEGFGSVEAIATAKGEIYQGLADDGVAIINLDDHFAGQWLQEIGERNWLGFSLVDHSADLYATDVHIDKGGRASFELCSKVGKVAIDLQILGRANVANALAAAACTVPLGATLATIKSGLEKFSAVPGRLCLYEGVNGCWVIDDSYNANPGSVKAAIDVLAELPGKRLLVLGDMGELGAEAKAAHKEIGRYAKTAGLDGLLTAGPLSELAAQEFGEQAQSFINNAALSESLINELDASVVVLIKGSRSAGMESVVQAILKEGV
ncbi:UDP-N-acetylmuramoyl-tripeptide--D-alanyl-D-alanine ligase [Halioxenophilus sp. WMMB6]|uniref:UDP-N-acetylmuramoyl-tripeptide--D-alanyl-D- alanine ligase n=1 Tax=Halioxenophilus sp. WMMB6 TaxID=3073815 RepID=UPI00295ED494|nr:UDP-N-acetylmuramoyl-tripeptide--D-alanyl-D-alanine ligase [Halioxenophilus sp. WMMB6]